MYPTESDTIRLIEGKAVYPVKVELDEEDEWVAAGWSSTDLPAPGLIVVSHWSEHGAMEEFLEAAQEYADDEIKDDDDREHFMEGFLIDTTTSFRNTRKFMEVVERATKGVERAHPANIWIEYAEEEEPAE